MAGASNIPEVGDVVEVCTEDRRIVNGLVVAVHGSGWKNPETNVMQQPSINCVFTSPDSSKSDSYGRQVDRLSSLSHYESGPNKMDNPGRYWKFPS